MPDLVAEGARGENIKSLGETVDRLTANADEAFAGPLNANAKNIQTIIEPMILTTRPPHLGLLCRARIKIQEKAGLQFY